MEGMKSSYGLTFVGKKEMQLWKNIDKLEACGIGPIGRKGLGAKDSGGTMVES